MLCDLTRRLYHDPMFRSVIAALFLTAASAAAQDSPRISQQIAKTGLAATAQSLSGASAPSDRFALGGVLFLRAVEKTLQTRWRQGASINCT